MPAASLGRAVYLLASLLLVWAVVAYFTGGVGWMLGPLRISSRQPLRPFMLGLALGGWYVWKFSGHERAANGAWMETWATRLVRATLPVVVVLGLYVGVHYGSFAAAGSDSYGYVSQARLWLSGIPRVEQAWVQEFSWPNREWMFSPLGYRPLSADGTIVPTYPAGLPILMAVFLAVIGDSGPFYVVPVLGAFTLWFTYLLGTAAAGSRTVGAAAALLLLASPVFLTHLIVPMSDVPAAAGWTLAAVLILKQRPFPAGIVAGMTLLIRPNLLPLTLVAAFGWRFRREPLAAYAIGLLPGVLAIVIVNTLLYGDPLSTGYGSLFELYAFGALPMNARNYLVWLVQTQTPLILLAVVPLLVPGALKPDDPRVSPRACLAALGALTLLCYLFYATFDHWFYLRFLLPAYPALFVLFASSIRWFALRLPVEGRVPAASTVCVAMMLFGVSGGRHEGILNAAAYEGRHIRAAGEIGSRTPPDAIVLAVQHSGSVRYYADRITLRYDWLNEDALDDAVRDVTAKGRRMYLVVDDWEEKEFRARFSPANRTAQLRDPIARVPGRPEVRIFELQDGGPAPTQ